LLTGLLYFYQLAFFSVFSFASVDGMNGAVHPVHVPITEVAFADFGDGTLVVDPADLWLRTQTVTLDT
jgi:hypothetical protein